MFICHHCREKFNGNGIKSIFCSKECCQAWNKEGKPSNKSTCTNCKQNFNTDALRFFVGTENFCNPYCIAEHYRKEGALEGSVLERKAILVYLDNEMFKSELYVSGTTHYIGDLIKQISMESHLQIVYQNVSTTPPKDEHTCSWKECPLKSEEQKKLEWKKAAEKYKDEKNTKELKKQALIWYETENSVFGMRSPKEMCSLGRGEEVLAHLYSKWENVNDM